MKTFISLVLLFPASLFAQAEFLTLEKAWEMALQENPSEEVARARLNQAKARYQQARSRYQPTLGLSASGYKVKYSDTALDQYPSGTPDNAELYDASLQATWLLWDSGVRKNTVASSDYLQQASEASQMDSREQLLAEVGQAFTAAQLARANLRIAEADVEFQNRQLENSIRKEQAGLDSRTDRLNFEIRKLDAENTAVQQEANFVSSMAALGALLGQPIGNQLPPPVTLKPDDDSLPTEIPDVETLWNQARESLPLLRQSHFQVEASRANMNALKGEYGPDLSLFGNLNAERESDPAFASDDLGNAVGIQLSWDLWTGNVRKQRVIEADYQLRESQATFRQQQLQALSVIKQAHAEFLASVASENLSAKTLALSEENRNLVEASYQAGRETLLRLNEAQRDFNNAGSRYVASRLQRQLAWIRIQQATGTLRNQVGAPEDN
ncbi:TolC family protein [Kiritimatiellaeota bacterium B1221]|nr:TolC family protein [Kiritimatiellaeota bacterium B1221]